MENQKLPGAQSSLILGIFSIITSCCCYGVPGLILGYIGLTKAKKAIETHESNPNQYDGIGNANAGKITSIIGLVLGVIFVIYLIYMITSGKFSEMMEQQRQLIEQMQNQ